MPHPRTGGWAGTSARWSPCRPPTPNPSARSPPAPSPRARRSPRTRGAGTHARASPRGARPSGGPPAATAPASCANCGRSSPRCVEEEGRVLRVVTRDAEEARACPPPTLSNPPLRRRPHLSSWGGARPMPPEGEQCSGDDSSSVNFEPPQEGQHRVSHHSKFSKEMRSILFGISQNAFQMKWVVYIEVLEDSETLNWYYHGHTNYQAM